VYRLVSFHHTQLIAETQVLAFCLLYIGLRSLLMSVMGMDRSSSGALVRSFTILAAHRIGVRTVGLPEGKIRCCSVETKIENSYFEGRLEQDE
jgi:hypothetical protein